LGLDCFAGGAFRKTRRTTFRDWAHASSSIEKGLVGQRSSRHRLGPRREIFHFGFAGRASRGCNLSSGAYALVQTFAYSERAEELGALMSVTIQSIGVVLIVAAAVGYLAVLLRRAWKGQAGCGSCHSSSAPHHEESKPVQQLFMPAENLADAADRLRRQRSSSDTSDS